MHHTPFQFRGHKNKRYILKLVLRKIRESEVRHLSSQKLYRIRFVRRQILAIKVAPIVQQRQSFAVRKNNKIQKNYS